MFIIALLLLFSGDVILSSCSRKIATTSEVKKKALRVKCKCGTKKINGL